MKLSLKVRYGIASMVYLGRIYDTNEHIPLQVIADRLEISKVYLEQVFPYIRKARLVDALKGSKGGYRLSRPPEAITIYDIVFSIEATLFDETEGTFQKSAPILEQVLTENIYQPLNQKLYDFFHDMTIADLTKKIDALSQSGGNMYYI